MTLDLFYEIIIRQAQGVIILNKPPIVRFIFASGILLLSIIIIAFSIIQINNVLSAAPAMSITDNPNTDEMPQEVDETFNYQTNASNLPLEETDQYEENGFSITKTSYTFPEGEIFELISAIPDNPVSGAFPYNKEIILRGNRLNYYWQEYSENQKQWKNSGEISSLPKALLFIETDLESIIIAPPSIYESESIYYTRINAPDLEKPLVIQQNAEISEFTIKYEFPSEPGYTSEIWYIKSKDKLIDWTEENKALWMNQDLFKNRKLTSDGYYFRLASSYELYTPNTFFRNPANFTGAQLLAASGSRAADVLGYVTTKICLKNQNAEGFWETGPKANWLWEDYGIGNYFFDTRFNVDFASSLIDAYEKYNESVFIEGAVKFADFFCKFAEENAYETESKGWLVPDYGYYYEHTKTHVSLNHQLAEINFLLKLYKTTNDSIYLNTAYKMLEAVKDTKESWIMEDHNLKYALHYYADTRELKDYPYLTYNDLFETRKHLQDLQIDTSYIQYLMDNKKMWMDSNNISLYKR